MPGDVDIAAVAALLADTTRATMLLALSDGRAFTASELAQGASVAPSTASEHLSRLVDANLVKVAKQGRHRYFQMADPALVDLLEGMARLAPTITIRSLNAAEHAKALSSARMCYNHLAGKLGVRLTDALVEKAILRVTDTGYVLEADGPIWLQRLGIGVEAFNRHGAHFAPWHIDWSERKRHLAGPLSAALAARLLELRWIERRPASRIVFLTERGRASMQDAFGLSF